MKKRLLKNYIEGDCNMKYKVGDKVKIKSLEWYNTFKDDEGVVDCGQWYFDKKMSRFCGKIVTICESDDMFNWYRIREENDSHIKYNNNMIEGLADESQEKMVSLNKACKVISEMVQKFCPNLIRCGEDLKYWENEFIKKLEE